MRRFLHAIVVQFAIVGILALAALLWGPLAAASAATWHGTAEGIRVGDRHASSGTPPDDVTSHSDDNYQVTLHFSFSVQTDGRISGTGNGHYDDTHWHLEGHNGTKGGFSCDPAVTGKNFSVAIGGHATGDRAHLTISIAGEERNEDYDCGADYTGYATTSSYMADSLEAVGGDQLDISLQNPRVPTLTKETNTGSGDNTKRTVDIWSFSFTPPTSESGGTGAAGSCKLDLSAARAVPKSSRVGLPTSVLFTATAPSSARLLVTPVGKSARTVVIETLPAGPNALVWGGWLGRRPAPAGRYDLTVEARGCNAVKRRSIRISVH